MSELVGSPVVSVFFFIVFAVVCNPRRDLSWRSRDRYLRGSELDAGTRDWSIEGTQLSHSQRAMLALCRILTSLAVTYLQVQ